ncbi:MAG: metal-binding protein [Clostridium sp.]|nr:metal-binding protein [Clostridium sp.]
MILTDIMKYIESEYKVINNTPCEICGGDYEADNLEIILINNKPFDVCECSCVKCGHEKTFEFYAPFVEVKTNKNNSNLN